MWRRYRLDLQVFSPARHRGLGELARADLAVARIRVRGEKAGELGPRPLADALQHGVGLGDHARVVVRLGGVAGPQLVCLGLVVAAVFQEEESQSLLGEAGVRAKRAHEHGAREESDARDLRARDLLRAVTRGHVSALVAQDARQLGLGVQVRQDPSRDVDVASRDRERVDDGGVQDAEVPSERRKVRDGRDSLPDGVRIALHRRISVEPVFRDDRGIGFAAHRGFLAGADEGNLPLAGRGIRGASRDRDREDRCNEQRDCEHTVKP